MTDKLTDEQIIKALECCGNNQGCDNCPLYARDSCYVVEEKAILDLINRQNAEIERLQKAIKVQDIMIEQQDYELKTAKSEAIKEFEKRFREIIPAIDDSYIEAMERTVEVYDVNGKMIKKYEGRFDIETDNVNGCPYIVFDDEKDKRHIIYYTTGTIIIDEQ